MYVYDMCTLLYVRSVSFNCMCVCCMLYQDNRMVELRLRSCIGSNASWEDVSNYLKVTLFVFMLNTVRYIIIYVCVCVRLCVCLCMCSYVCVCVCAFVCVCVGIYLCFSVCFYYSVCSCVWCCACLCVGHIDGLFYNCAGLQDAQKRGYWWEQNQRSGHEVFVQCISCEYDQLVHFDTAHM